MKKKGKLPIIIIIVLVALVGLYSLGSGGTQKTDGKKPIVQNASGNAEAQNAANEGNASEGEAVADSQKSEGDEAAKEDIAASEGNGTDSGKTEAISIEEQVLLEHEGLKITAKEMVNDSIWGPGIKLLIENDSNQNYGIGCNALIVNNYMVSDLFSETVAPGKKVNETIHILSHDLKNAGIDTIGQIDIYFHLFDADSFLGIYDADCVTIRTSAYDRMDIVKLDEGKELFNEDGIRIVGKYVDENSIWGASVLLYIDNDSGKNVTVQADDMSINGFMVTPLFSSSVYNGRMSIDDITILSSDLEKNGITSVDEIELKFHIFNTDTFETIKDSDVITFSTK